MFVWSVSLLALCAAAGALYIGFNAAERLPGHSYYTVRAEFRDVNTLPIHSPVVMSGRRVGQVTEEGYERGRAVVTLQIAADEGPLPSDTTARARPRTPLGDPLIDLLPGNDARRLPDGGTIPVDQTSASVPLDDVLSTLDSKTRRGTQVVVNELGRGFAGRGQQLNDLTRQGPAFLRDGARAARAVTDLDGAARRFVGESERALAAVEPVREEFAQGLRPTERALRPLADHADSVRSTLTEAPPVLRVARSRLPVVDAGLRELNSLIRESRPLLQAAPPAFDQLHAALRETRGPLKRTRPALRALRRSVPPTLGLLRDLRPLLPRFRTAFDNSRPLADALGPRECDVEMWGRRWRSWLGLGILPEGPFGPQTALRLAFSQTAESLGSPSKPTVGVRGNPYPAPCEAGNELKGR